MTVCAVLQLHAWDNLGHGACVYACVCVCVSRTCRAADRRVIRVCEHPSRVLVLRVFRSGTRPGGVCD